jgi:transcriptional regulator with XRE-family HTH domain
MTGPVQAAREALGTRLRDIRMDARLSGRQLAVLTGWHFTKVSKIEHGHTMPTEADLEQWCFHCRALGELPDLTATARNIERMYAEIKRLMRTGTARYQREILEDHARSRRFRHFQIALLPGPLQTPGYATAVLQDAAAMLGHPADVEPTVAARMERARLMRSGERLFHFALLQTALTSRIAPPAVMRDQLAHLLDVAGLPNVHLGIVPDHARRYMPMCGFFIVDDRYVEVETFSAIARLTQPGEIAVYAKVFDRYARLAVYGGQARDLITRALSEFEQLGETI